MNVQIHFPPTPTHHILLNVVNIQVIPEPLLTIFLVMESQKRIPGNIATKILEHLPQSLISPNTFAYPIHLLTNQMFLKGTGLILMRKILYWTTLI